VTGAFYVPKDQMEKIQEAPVLVNPTSKNSSSYPMY